MEIGINLSITGTINVPDIGPHGGAALFDGGGGNRLAATNALLAAVGLDWSWQGWFNLASNADYFYFLDFGDGNLRIRNTDSHVMQVEARSGADGYKDISGPGNTINTWHHVAVTYSAAAKTMTFYIDNILIGTAVFTEDPTMTATAVAVGLLWPGRIDSLGYHRGRCLGSDDVAYFWNGGAGRSYRTLDAAAKVDLTSWWDLEEGAGTRLDRRANINLTEVGTVGLGIGVQ